MDEALSTRKKILAHLSQNTGIISGTLSDVHMGFGELSIFFGVLQIWYTKT